MCLKDCLRKKLERILTASAAAVFHYLSCKLSDKIVQKVR